MTKIKPFIIPLILFIFAFLLRLSLISKGPFSCDCLTTINSAEETLRTFKLHYQNYGFGYPMAIISGAFFIAITKLFSLNDSVFAINLMSVVYSSLCIPLFYILVKQLLNSIAAIFSSLILIIYPMFLGISVYGTSHSPSLFYLFLGIVLLLKYFREADFRCLIFAGISIGFMGASRIHEMVLVLPAITYLYFLKKIEDKKKFPDFKTTVPWLKHYVIFLFSVTMATAIFYTPLLIEHVRAQFNNQLSVFVKNELYDNFRGLLSPSLSYALSYFLFSFSFIGFICAFIGSYLMFKRDRKVFTFLFLWLVIPIAFYGNLYSTVFRYLLVSSIPLIVATGYLFTQLMNRSAFFKQTSLAVFLLVIFLMSAKILPTLYFRHLRAPLVDFAKWFSTNTEPNAKIISVDDASFIARWGKREILPRPASWFSLDKEALASFKKQLDLLLDKKTPVYITHSGLTTYDRNLQFVDLMFDDYNLYEVDNILYEDWHQGEPLLNVKFSQIYKITRK